MKNQAVLARYGRDFSDQIWVDASAKYARTAEGDVYVFANGANQNRIFTQVELPILESSSLVNDILYLDNPLLDLEPTTPRFGY